MTVYDVEVSRSVVVHETLRISVEGDTAAEAEDLAFHIASEYPYGDQQALKILPVKRTYTSIKAEPDTTIVGFDEVTADDA